MVADATGASPIGIFLLADDYLAAARLTAQHDRLRVKGPTRLLSYHSCELFLKAYLREPGETEAGLRLFGHDLQAMMESACAKGLALSPQLVAQIIKATGKKDYVRVRYMVTEERSDIPEDKVLRLAMGVRECVRLAMGLNNLGMPEAKSPY